MVFELHRLAFVQEGAFGVLLSNGIPFAVTLQPTDQDLKTKIPPGSWRCTRSFFYRGGYPSFEILVPGHSRLLFHRGNLEDDSDGCVLVAESFGQLRGRAAVLDSAAGFAELMRRAYQDEFMLEVTDRRPPT